MLTEERLQAILAGKDTEAALATGQAEGWAIVDGAMIIYDCNAPPWWFPVQDEDGNSVRPQTLYCEAEESPMSKGMRKSAEQRAANMQEVREGMGLE